MPDLSQQLVTPADTANAFGSGHNPTVQRFMRDRASPSEAEREAAARDEQASGIPQESADVSMVNAEPIAQGKAEDEGRPAAAPTPAQAPPMPKDVDANEHEVDTGPATDANRGIALDPAEREAIMSRQAEFDRGITHQSPESD